MKRSRLLLILALIPFATLKLAMGCSAQGEGQLCNSLNNTNDDCAGGLVCTAKVGYMACCPPPPAISTQPACVGNGNTTVGNGGSGNGGSTTTSTTSSSTTTSSTTTSTTTTTTGTGGAGTGGMSTMLDGGDGG